MYDTDCNRGVYIDVANYTDKLTTDSFELHVQIVGGNISGKAVCEDLCFSAGSFTSATGPVLNVNDVTRSAGGSSSGSGALVSMERRVMSRTLNSSN